MSRRAAVAALAAAGWVFLAPPAQAVQTCETRANIRQKDPNASLAFGDSVMLAAAKQLAAYGFSVDAQACRQMNQGLEVMQEHELPSLVVIALGSNHTVSAQQVRSALEMVGPFGRIVFVLPNKLGGGPDPDGRVFRAAESAYPDQVSILDWPAYSSGHPDWLASDGLHLTSTGAAEFARFIAEAPELGPAPEELEPLPEPERERRPEPKPVPAGPDPLFTAMWHGVARTFAVVLEPAARLLGQFAHGGSAEPEDL